MFSVFLFFLALDSFFIFTFQLLCTFPQSVGALLVADQAWRITLLDLRPKINPSLSTLPTLTLPERKSTFLETGLCNLFFLILLVNDILIPYHPFFCSLFMLMNLHPKMLRGWARMPTVAVQMPAVAVPFRRTKNL